MKENWRWHLYLIVMWRKSTYLQSHWQLDPVQCTQLHTWPPCHGQWGWPLGWQFHLYIQTQNNMSLTISIQQIVTIMIDNSKCHVVQNRLVSEEWWSTIATLQNRGIWPNYQKKKRWALQVVRIRSHFFFCTLDLKLVRNNTCKKTCCEKSSRYTISSYYKTRHNTTVLACLLHVSNNKSQLAWNCSTICTPFQEWQCASDVISISNVG